MWPRYTFGSMHNLRKSWLLGLGDTGVAQSGPMPRAEADSIPSRSVPWPRFPLSVSGVISNPLCLGQEVQRGGQVTEAVAAKLRRIRARA